MSVTCIIKTMETLSPSQIVEQFHLLFLDQLGQQLDKRLYALKGGCNLRFYFQSIRYSEDIDIDVTTINKATLANKVQKILASTPFQQILQIRGIAIQNVHAVKQTDTTQRWKMLLKSVHSSLAIHTKIEFSRRGMDEGIEFGTINKLLIQRYQLPPIFIPHYDANTALKQKLSALINRTETQARDVFDIHLLLNIAADAKTIMASLPTDERRRVIESTLNISFDYYKSLVVSYLDPIYTQQYDDPKLWENMQLSLVEMLS